MNQGAFLLCRNATGFTSRTARMASSRFFEGTSFRPLHTIGFSGDADNIRYDREAMQVYIG